MFLSVELSATVHCVIERFREFLCVTDEVSVGGPLFKEGLADFIGTMLSCIVHLLQQQKSLGTDLTYPWFSPFTN